MIDKFIPGKSVLSNDQDGWNDSYFGVISEIPEWLAQTIQDWDRLRLLTNETYESAAIMCEMLDLLFEREEKLKAQMAQVEKERRQLKKKMLAIWNELPPAKPAYIKE